MARRARAPRELVRGETATTPDASTAWRTPARARLSLPSPLFPYPIYGQNVFKSSVETIEHTDSCEETERENLPRAFEARPLSCCPRPTCTPHGLRCAAVAQ